MEMMDKPAIHAAEDFVHAGYPRDAEALLIVELDGPRREVELLLDRVEKIAGDNNSETIRVSTNEAERQVFWAGRKAAFPAVGRISPDYYCMDGTIPRRELPHVLANIHAASERYGLPVANVFHAGDGNLHPLILYDANRAGELEQAEKLGAEILSMCITAGGTVTGEHGVGMEKIDSMCEQFNKAELEQFHALKAAFDPAGLLNPGKAVPTLHRCAELGAMHVHKGKLPFPDLPRF
jgi:glycolate oxidase